MTGHTLRASRFIGLATSALLLTAVTAVAVQVSAGAASPGSPARSGPALTPAQQKAMLAQAEYLSLDSQVRTALTADVLAGTEIDVVGHRYYVYSTRKPATLSALSARARSAGISLVFRPAKHSVKQLQQVTERLALLLHPTGAFSIELATDGSGLRVKSGNLDRAPAAVLAAVRHLSATTGVAIASASQVEAVHLASRDADTSPYYGGAVTVVGNLGCTDGFSMYATGSTARFMLTAAHCSNFLDGQAVYTGAGSYMGTTDFIHELYDQTPSYDMGVIRLSGGQSNDGRIYNTDTNSVPIVGYAANGIPSGGNYCLSGAVSTPNCNLISGAQDFVSAGGPRAWWVVTMTIKAGATGPIMCKGDSGGPIYYSNSSGYIAAGIVSVGYGPTGSTCFNAIGASVVASAINRINGLALVHY
ncbi:trypsin-like serine protease [Jatrophihabitans sp.]|uniref:trypsin-like serine protease n=1 Tax=Jatrophihabitans sp. TaxID=1932789 RepID=UPI002EF1FB5B